MRKSDVSAYNMYQSYFDIYMDFYNEGDKEQELLFIRTLLMYMFLDKDVDLSTLPLAVRTGFRQVKATIDAEKKRKIAGARGGAPKGNKNACRAVETEMAEATTNLTPAILDAPSETSPEVTTMVVCDSADETSNDNVNGNVKDNVNVNDCDIQTLHSMYETTKQLNNTIPFKKFQSLLFKTDVQETLKDYECDLKMLWEAVQNCVKVSRMPESKEKWNFFTIDSFIKSKNFGKYLPKNFNESLFNGGKPIVIPFSESEKYKSDLKFSKLRYKLPKCGCGKYFSVSNYTGEGHKYECHDCGKAVKPNKDMTEWVGYDCDIITDEDRDRFFNMLDKWCKPKVAVN